MLKIFFKKIIVFFSVRTQDETTDTIQMRKGMMYKKDEPEPGPSMYKTIIKPRQCPISLQLY